MPVSLREVEPELVEPEPVVSEVDPVVLEFVALERPVLIEPEVEPVVPELIEFVLPAVPVGLVVALPEELGFEVEPEFTEPLVLLAPGPALDVAGVPVALPLVPPVEPVLPVPPVEVLVPVPPVEPLVPVPPVPPPDCA
jgi:hypothetical protein